MRNASKTLRFPLAGVVKKYPYRTSSSNAERGEYGAPAAVNVRGTCVFESRLRGGSRPPLVRLASVSAASGVGAWLWPNGTALEWSDGGAVTYAVFASAATVPGGGRLIRLDTTRNVVADKGSVPSGHSVSAIYRDRVVLIKDELWYMSRQGDYADFDLGADMDDIGRAAAGGVAITGEAVESITAVIPVDDDRIYIATANSLWVLRGEPTTGALTRISDTIGIVAPWAWARNGGEHAFLSNDGVYVLGEGLSKWSDDRTPDELRNVAVSANTVTMIYDVSERGYHLFITPASGVGRHYWLDPQYKAVWPVVLDADNQPVAVARIADKSLERVALLGRDGVWRSFDPAADAEDIDETSLGLASSVSIGPFQLAPDAMDGLLAEVHLSLASESADVIVEVSTGLDAEGAVDAISSPVFSFNVSAGRNRVFRPRARGSWCVLTFRSLGSWAFESMTIETRQLGRLR